VLAGAAACVVQALEGIAAEYNVPFDKEAAALDMLPGAGRPAPVAVYPVETLAAGAAMQQQQLPLAQGFVPPPAGAPPTAAQRQPAVETWRPDGMPAPKGAAPAPAPAASPAQQHAADVLTGGSVVVRPGLGDASAAAPPAAPDRAGWGAPKPEDMNRQGIAFQTHVGSAAAWRQNRLGLTPRGSGSGSSSQELQQPAQGPPPTAPAPIPPSSSMDQLPSGIEQSSGGSTPSVGDRPSTPSGSYADASAAADAAKRYSHMAQEAAQRAEEFASIQPPGSSAATAAAPAGGTAHGGAAGGGDASPDGSRLVPRTVSEVQRSYDAAPGPPSKAQAMAPGPPSAPPAAADASAGGAAGSSGGGAAGGDGEVDISGLPSVPQPGAAGEPAVQDELDELTRRFEQLKRR
jgi:hypothetical protein